MIELDAFERDLVLALRRHPRARVTELAAELSADERTVGRTISRLQETGVLELSALVLHENANGWLVAQVEFDCRPGFSESVARALAARSDTRFVAAVTGSSDVVADLVAPNTDALYDVLNAEFGRLEGVVAVRTHLVTRLLLTAADWDPSGFLSERRKAVSTGGDAAVPRLLDDTDLQIVSVLQRDARSSLAAIAKEIDVHETTVQRRLKTMITAGHLTIRADVPPALLGFPVESRFTMAVRPSGLAAALQRLVAEPALRALYATTGPSPVLGYSVHRSLAELEALSERTFAEIPELTAVDVSLVLRAYKRSGVIQRRLAEEQS